MLLKEKLSQLKFFLDFNKKERARLQVLVAELNKELSTARLEAAQRNSAEKEEWDDYAAEEERDHMSQVK